MVCDRLLPAQARAWLNAHDPGYGALRRAGRAAIIMPSLFAVGDKLIANTEMSYFMAFGSLAMLLMVDFSGTMLDRVRAQASLGCCCALLICVGTLLAQSTISATAGMFAAAFVVIFSGVVSSVIASATTPLLLAFILPVTLRPPLSEIAVGVAGWGIAVIVSLAAITVLWPAPVTAPVERRAIDACRAIAARIRAEVAWILDDSETPQLEAAFAQARSDAESQVAQLDRLFLATPYRPTGLSAKARAEIRLVDELRWLSDVVLRSGPRARPAGRSAAVCAVKLAAAQVLELSAGVLETGREIEALTLARERLHRALRGLEEHTTALDTQARPASQDQVTLTIDVISALDPSFRAQELAYVTDQIGLNAEYAAAAANRPWSQRLLGRPPAGFSTALSSARERAPAHAQLSSSWLHNSLRGAAGLALAVLVCDITSVQHGFWVVFGTLAVLRSNALSTGQNVMRGLLGTTVGFVVGGALVALLGTNTALLWALLPVAVLFGGLAPTMISFAAGQAAFTLTLLVLFNLLIPGGWSLGLIRVEDVAIGGAVSVIVGLLFWPRGAGADLGRALGRAYVDSSQYLSDAVAFGVACCDAASAQSGQPRAQAVRAAASARRLDDTFRGYLTERGAKRAALADVTALVTGVAGVRLAADAVLGLWDGEQSAGSVDGSRVAVRRELITTAAQLSSWFASFAAGLDGSGEVPDAIPEDPDANGRLVQSVRSDLRDGDGHWTATGVRVIWTGDHLDAVRRLQHGLVAPARLAKGSQPAGSGALNG